MTQSDNPLPHAPTGIRGGPPKWRTGIVLVGFLLLVVFFQWPMFKGLYYRAFGAPPPPDGIAWRQDLPAALLESAHTGKPLLVNFSASWCPPCQVMRHESWPDPLVAQSANERFIPVYLDVDTPSGTAPAQKYAVNAIPTVLILDSQGNIQRRANFLEAAALRLFLSPP